MTTRHFLLTVPIAVVFWSATMAGAQAPAATTKPKSTDRGAMDARQDTVGPS